MAITPYLLYEDVAQALKFLAKAFGFRNYGAPVMGRDGKVSHAAMKIGDDTIMMGCPGAGYRNPKRLGQATQSLYINVDDVDKHLARARKAGATVIKKPAITVCVLPVHVAEDPEGHQWYFAQDVPRLKRKRKTS